MTAQAYLGFEFVLSEKKAGYCLKMEYAPIFLVPCSYNYRAYVRVMYVCNRQAIGTLWAFRCRSETHQEKSCGVRAVSLLQEVGVLSKDHAILGHLSADDTSYSREDGKEE